MLYDFSFIESMKKESKKWYVRVAIIFCITLMILMGIAFFVNDSTKIWLQIVSTVLFVLGGWLALFFIFNKIVFLYRKIHFFEALNNTKKVTQTYLVLDFDKDITLSRNVTAQQLWVKMNETKIVLYWDLSLGECPLKANTQYSITSSCNFVLSFKEIDSNDEGR